MNKERFAGLDIGSNTVLMLIVEKEDNGINITRDEHSIARLGENVWKTNVISDEAITRAEIVLEKYKNICEKEQVKQIFANATSAMRDAKNGKEVSTRLSKKLGTEISIIPGDKEAELTYIGTIENEKPSVVVDIGGGSTEIIFGKNSKIDFKQSINIGAVKLTDKFFPKHPPKETELQDMRDFIRENLSVIPKIIDDSLLYAVAGTPTTLAAVDIGLRDYQSKAINLHNLKLSHIKKITDTFLSLSVQDIISYYGIEPMRADIITAGSIILEECLSYFQKDFCIVSVYGLRLGILKEKLK